MKKKIISIIMLVGLLSSVMFLSVGCSSKETSSGVDFPNKPVQFIVPWSPGGGSDNAMRIVAKHLEKQLGVAVPVINKPGVSGTLGLNELKGKPANGYNIGMIHEGLLVSYHTDVTDINYDDFIPVATMTDSPQYLAVSNDLPVETIEEFIEYAQEHSGELKYGTTLRGIPHAQGAILADAIGTKFKYVAYEGTSKRIQALAGGFVDVIIVDHPSSAQFVESGKFKVIAAFTEERMDVALNTPTMIEKGYDLVFAIKRGIVAPKETPEEVIKVLEEALKETANDEAFINDVKKAGLEVDFNNSEEYKAYLEKQDGLIKKVAKDL